MHPLSAAIPPLSREEEAALLRQSRAGDTAARHKLALSLLPWAFKTAKRYYGKGMTTADYFQLAMVGVLEAIDTHDLGLGRLITHANWMMRRQISYAQRDGDLIRLPQRAKDDPNKFCALTDAEKKEAATLDLWFMSQLTPRERFILRCRYWLGMQHKDIGKRLGFSKQYVHLVIFSILRRVREAEAEGVWVLNKNSELHRGYQRRKAI